MTDRRFQPLFTVGTAHPAYAGPCPDVGFAPLPGTAELLAPGRRLLARQAGGAMTVLYAVGADGQPTVSLAGRTLWFALVGTGPGFFNYTALPAGPGQAALYANVANPTAFDAPSVVQLVGGALRHPIAAAGRPAVVRVKSAGGQVVAEQTATDPGATAASFDAAGWRTGRYTLEEEQGGNVARTDLFVGAAGAMPDGGSGVFGVVGVTVAAGFYAAPPAFTVALSARAETVKYYVVANQYTEADLDQPANLLAVTDLSNNGGGGGIVFDAVRAGAFGPADVPAARVGGASPVVLFRSRDPVPRLVRPRRRVQLSRAGDVLVADLPQPGAGRPNADFVVPIWKS